MTTEEFGIKDATALCRPRDIDSHKGSYGHGLLIAGSYGMAGAAIMAAQASIRSGIGLLTVSTPECNRSILQTAVPEAMVRTNGAQCWETVPEHWTNPITDIATLQKIHSAIAIGPGLGISEQTSVVLLKFLTCIHNLAGHSSVILDADALNIIASSDCLDLLEGTVISPHPGEFDRLLKCCGQSYSKGRRTEQASEFAVKYNCHVILKGHATVVASPDGDSSVNTTGNPGMATGGSGDVLTGILLALCAQGFSQYDATRLGVFIHGLAGDIAADRLGQISMAATDITVFLPEAWKRTAERQ